jgi:hypothetical protein
MLVGGFLAAGGVVSIARSGDTYDLGRTNAILIGIVFLGCGLGLIGIGWLNARRQ